MIRPENRNILWATILADELARVGIRHAVIAPGSRSTALAVAFSRDERFTIHSIIDERAAGFFGLGIGKTEAAPAVIICTSGTAAANFFPAVVEASLTDTPLIVITADRPHELRDSGANQTIDQVHLYGRYARWFVDIAPPHADPEAKTLRYLRTTIDRAVAAARGAYLRDSGVRIGGGPVHLNVPFEKPLEPVEVEGDVPEGAELVGAGKDGAPASLSKIGLPQLKITQFESVIDDLLESPRGVIVCGAAVPDSVVDALARLAQATGYPLLAEGGTRFYAGGDHVLSGYETFLRGDFAEQVRPQLIFQVGGLPIGNALLTYLEKQTEARRIVIGALNGGWADESHLTTTFIEAEPITTLLALGRVRHKEGSHAQWNIDPEWIKPWQAAERIAWEETAALTSSEQVEGAVVADVVDGMESGLLFIANSNPVRHFDQFVRPGKKSIRVEMNRGASGIDGTVASALGAARGRGSSGPSVLVIGDLALYHDLNSLHLIRRLNIPLIIVCINNDGGGIFHRLPIAAYDPPFRDLFITPHGLTFENAAKMFDIPYTLADMGDDFRAAFKKTVESGGPALIEVPSDAAQFEDQRKRLIKAVAERIKDSGILEKSKNAQAF